MYTKEVCLKLDIIGNNKIKMKITLENFSDIKKKIAKSGIAKVHYGTQGNALSFTTKDGNKYELDPIDFKDFEAAELVRLGIKLQKSVL